MDERLLTTPCTLLQISDGTADVYGDPTPGTVAYSLMCHYEQVASKESETEVVETTTWRIWLSGTAPVPTGWDLVQIGSDLYGFTGDASPLIRPSTGLVDHIEGVITRER